MAGSSIDYVPYLQQFNQHTRIKCVPIQSVLYIDGTSLRQYISQSNSTASIPYYTSFYIVKLCLKVYKVLTEELNDLYELAFLQYSMLLAFFHQLD